MRTPLDFRPCRTIEEAARERGVDLRISAWGNAHRIQNDHELDITRIEREAAMQAADRGRP